MEGMAWGGWGWWDWSTRRRVMEEKRLIPGAETEVDLWLVWGSWRKHNIHGHLIKPHPSLGQSEIVVPRECLRSAGAEVRLIQLIFMEEPIFY